MSESLIDETLGRTIGAWIIAIPVDAGVARVVYWMLSGGFYATQLPMFIIFAVAVGLATVNAARWTCRLVRFGRSKVNLDPPQGQIGGQLAGTIFTPRPLPPDTAIRFRLTCKRTAKQMRQMDAGGGAVRFVNDYEDEQRTHFRPSLGPVNKLPFAFDIPDNQWATTHWNGLYSIQWKLQAFSDTSSVDYRSDFVVPIAAAKSERATDSLSGAEQPSGSSRAPEDATQDQDRARRKVPTIKKRRSSGVLPLIVFGGCIVLFVSLMRRDRTIQQRHDVLETGCDEILSQLRNENADFSGVSTYQDSSMFCIEGDLRTNGEIELLRKQVKARFGLDDAALDRIVRVHLKPADTAPPPGR